MYYGKWLVEVCWVPFWVWQFELRFSISLAKAASFSFSLWLSPLFPCPCSFVPSIAFPSKPLIAYSSLACALPPRFLALRALAFSMHGARSFAKCRMPWTFRAPDRLMSKLLAITRSSMCPMESLLLWRFMELLGGTLGESWHRFVVFREG